MKNSTVSKGPARPGAGAMAAEGQITKGSSGAPKAEKGDRFQRRLREDKTTSANASPGPVPKDFVNKLAEMHTAERELTLAIPLLIASADSKDLKKLLQLHLKETRGHLKAIEAVAKNLAVELPTKGCKRMTQLIAEGVKIMGKKLVGSADDKDLIAGGQKIEQFEMDSYSGLLETAKEERYTHEVALLTSILTQEKLAHALLGQLAEGKGPIDELIGKISLEKAGATKTDLAGGSYRRGRS